jgi:hypothetical protein
MTFPGLMGKMHEDICINTDFQNKTQVDQEVKARNDKWDYIKLKTFAGC